MNLWVSSTDGVAVSDNTFVSPFSYPPVANCCPPIKPLPQNMVVYATSSNNVTFANNCILNPPAASAAVSSSALDTPMAGTSGAQYVLFNTTSTVKGLHLVDGGVKVC